MKRISRKFLTLCGLFSILSQPAQAWNSQSHQSINAAALDVLEIEHFATSKINFVDHAAEVFRFASPGRLFRHYQVPLPEDLKRQRDVNMWFRATIEYRNQGFGGLKYGNMHLVFDDIVELAKRQSDPNAKMLLTLYASAMIAVAYQPTHTVSFFDHRTFSQGDRNGELYCLSKVRNETAGNCNLTLSGFWNSMTFPGLKADADEEKMAIQDIITDTADLAPHIYATRHGHRPVENYFRINYALGEAQQKKAAQQVSHYLRYIFESTL
ncbi:hypothetical protein LRP52_37100 [Photobacterium sp. ZSDE20]|uniref:Uncharacterized protein n=1 Tax=Photobacterium pectinilyticum TaxID=2906793 RepID=A0ABT1N797_9GAMM|nr:hypothetical protein [Photobacterium sp. ZSDE20]MCQ1060610.1 hypothetical protein [Photobacterium sp. ZSDE20]MDD1827805.1 hypothetical protein [Photobacterium sp. ZSDE20]